MRDQPVSKDSSFRSANLHYGRPQAAHVEGLGSDAGTACLDFSEYAAEHASAHSRLSGLNETFFASTFV